MFTKITYFADDGCWVVTFVHHIAIAQISVNMKHGAIRNTSTPNDCSCMLFLILINKLNSL